MCSGDFSDSECFHDYSTGHPALIFKRSAFFKNVLDLVGGHFFSLDFRCKLSFSIITKIGKFSTLDSLFLICSYCCNSIKTESQGPDIFHRILILPFISVLNFFFLGLIE